MISVRHNFCKVLLIYWDCTETIFFFLNLTLVTIRCERIKSNFFFFWGGGGGPYLTSVNLKKAVMASRNT